MEEALAPILGPAELRLTRTPLAGGAPTVWTEQTANPKRRILQCTIRRAQSLGTQEADLTLRDDALQVSSWASGDGVLLEGRGIAGTAWTPLVDGFVGPSSTRNVEGRPVVTLTVLGWSALFDLTSLGEELTYNDTPWTTIADDLVTQVLGGAFARTITPDPEAPRSITFRAGLKLREALDICRRALNAGPDKWEHRIEAVAGAKTYLLYKRGTAILKTLGRRDILPGSHVQRGDVTEVVNRAVVTGATVPSATEDRLAQPVAGTIRLATTTQRLAQPIEALDSPIAAFTLTGNRSGAQDPPTLNAAWARNAAGYDALNQGANDNGIFEGGGFGSHRGGVVADRNYATRTDSLTILALTTTTVVVYDLGANPPPIKAIFMQGTGGGKYVVQHSPDNVAWTTEYTSPAGFGAIVHYLAAPQTKRYWRLRAMNDTGASITATINAFHLSPWKNEGADATNPGSLQGGAPDSGISTQTTTTSSGAATREIAKFDLEVQGTSPAVARIVMRHWESIASVSHNLKVQYSTAAAPASSDWVDLAIVPSTTSIVEDTFYVERETFRWLRVIVVDDRAGGSAAITTNVAALRVYEHKSDRFRQPLPSDNMKGAATTWDVNSLIRNPGTFEERSYSAPRTAVIPDAYYWLLLWLQSASTAYSWWDLDYSCSINLANLGLYCGFEEADSTTCYDGGPYGYTGTYMPYTTGNTQRPAFVRAQVGLGIEIVPLVPQHVDFGFQTGHNPTTDFSLSIKINPRAIGAKVGILGKGNGQVGANGGSYSWFIDTDGRLLFAIWTTGGARVSAKSTTPLVAGTNYTLGVRVTGGVCTFLLNGVPDGGGPMAGTIQTVTAGIGLHIGEAFDTGAVRSSGDFVADELYLFTRGLTDAEFLALHNMRTTRRLMRSNDSGTTWFSAPADLLLRTRVRFNIHALQGFAENLASQAAYANLVPGGVLAGGMHDEALTTQAAVDAEAEALVNRRSTPPRRVQLVVPLDEVLQPGSKARLTPEAAGLVGLPSAQADVDVVEATLRFGPEATALLACDEYPLTADRAGDATIAFATRRTV